MNGLNLISKFKLNDFKTYLNNYGKALFKIENDSFLNFKSSLFPQLFEGYIADNIPIVFMFNKYNQNDSNINGIYTYIKYGNGLNINGSLKNNKLNVE